MRHILLDSLSLALDDLLTKRLPALQSFAAGAASIKILTLQSTKIAALPAVLKGRPLADELGAADARHDGIGSAVWHLIEAHLQHPDVTPAILAAAKEIRAAFIPSLGELGATYEAEAKAAKDRKDDIATLTQSLMLFPVVVGGATLLDWVQGFVGAGETLDDLLSARADAKDRRLAAGLRTEVIGTLMRMRKNLATEMKHDPTLPADLDAQVFGYFDLLETKAAEAAEAKKHAEEKKKAEAKKEAGPAAPPVKGTPEGGEGAGG